VGCEAGSYDIELLAQKPAAHACTPAADAADATCTCAALLACCLCCYLLLLARLLLPRRAKVSNWVGQRMGDMHVHDGADDYAPEAGGAEVSATAACCCCGNICMLVCYCSRLQVMRHASNLFRHKVQAALVLLHASSACQCSPVRDLCRCVRLLRVHADDDHDSNS
jgi:hypothetical protein